MDNKEDSSVDSTLQKALTINLDECKYGTIVEIGAGQEVARAFFRAGGAAGTIAKTMSAYDMQFSDAIYGGEESGRYVSRNRVHKMMTREFDLIIERLAESRKKNSTYFAYAATVAAKSFSGKNESHGWIGVCVQLYPSAEPSHIVLHVRMLDSDSRSQQEALGVLGVNLIYGAYYYYSNPKQLIEHLGDNLGENRVEIDLIDFHGPYFEEVQNSLMNLHLITSGLTRGIAFSPDGNVMIPADMFYKKHVLVIRGSFHPVTKVNQEMVEKGLEQFVKVEGVKKEDVLVLTEMTMANLGGGEQNFDTKDFLDRVDTLRALGYNVLISDYLRFFRLRAFLRRYTKKQIGIVLGVPNIRDIFNESYYTGLEGGILEAFGKLFPDNTRIYVYPAKDRRGGGLETAENLVLSEHLQHLYQHLLTNHLIIGLTGVDESLLDIFSRDVLAKIKKGRGDWEACVPEVVAKMIVENKMLGFNSE